VRSDDRQVLLIFGDHCEPYATVAAMDVVYGSGVWVRPGGGIGLPHRAAHQRLPQNDQVLLTFGRSV
jgi:hypothetical protein